MTEDGNTIIAKRYGIISVMMPVICVLMTFLGHLISGYESFYGLIPPLSFAACFGFIFTFFIDIRRRAALNNNLKVILMLAGAGICFLVPQVMDRFGITLVVVLAVSLFCAFLSFEASLILMVGFCLYIWAFNPVLLNSEMIIYITSVLLVCIMTRTCDNLAKTIYSVIIFTVFYLILNLIFRNADLSQMINLTVFTVWMYCSAIIVCLYLIRMMISEAGMDKDISLLNEKSAVKEKTNIEGPSDTSSNKSGIVGSGTSAVNEKKTEEQQRHIDEASKRAGIEHKTEESHDTEIGQNKNRGTETVQNENNISGTSVELKPVESNISDDNSKSDQPTDAENEYGSENTADPENLSDAESSSGGNEANNGNLAESDKSEDLSLDTSSDTVKDQKGKPQPKANPNKNRNLYDSIEELSSRLMKLESENSLLQLMINSSVYDLSTITDPDYPYILKLKEEKPKSYRHCLKVAQISADAAELIKCDSEEAYAIGMYIRAPKLIGDGASAVLSKTYRVPKNIITSVYKINDKANVTVMSREAGIVMLTDDIIYSYNYLKSKTNEEVPIERIVNNAIKVRKDQNCLRSAGFTNEEIQLLRLYYNDLGDKYDTTGTEGE